MNWAISGGAGFLGLHLARRLVADGHEVRSLDLVGLDDPKLEGSVRELRGDIRDERAARELVDGARILVHAAAALPIRGGRAEIQSVNVDARDAPLGGRPEPRQRVISSSTAVTAFRKTRSRRTTRSRVRLLRGFEDRGEDVCRAFMLLGSMRDRHAQGLIGPERLGVFASSSTG